MTLDECFKALELPRDASPEEVKAAYLDLVKVWHPDRYAHESPRLRTKAEEKLKAINRAYEFLRGGASGEASRPEEPEERPEPPRYPRTDPALHLSPMKFGELWGFVNPEGKLVIRPKWDLAEPFHDGLAHVVELGRHGFINQKGDYHVVPQFADARSYSQGLAAVVYTTKWAFIDRSGRCAITPLYEECHDFTEDVAAVRWRGRWGFIDRTGKYVLPPRYDEARPFRDGWAAVRMGERWGNLNIRGEVFFQEDPRLTEGV